MLRTSGFVDDVNINHAFGLGYGRCGAVLQPQQQRHYNIVHGLCPCCVVLVVSCAVGEYCECHCQCYLSDSFRTTGAGAKPACTIALLRGRTTDMLILEIEVQYR